MARVLHGENISRSDVGVETEDELKLPNAKKPTIPKEILEKASELKVDPEHIKIQGNMWTACEEGGACTPLGKVEQKAEVETEQKNGLIETQAKTRGLKPKAKQTIKQDIDLSYVKPGTKFFYKDPNTNQDMQYEFLQPPDTALSFRAGELGVFVKNNDKSFRLEKTRNLEIKVQELTVNIKSRADVVEYIRQRPDEAFMIEISVPAKCPPCKTLEARLPQIVKNMRAAGSEVTVISATFKDFDSAKKAWGENMRFPHMVLIGRKSDEESERSIEFNTGFDIEPIDYTKTIKLEKKLIELGKSDKKE